MPRSCCSSTELCEDSDNVFHTEKRDPPFYPKPMYKAFHGYDRVQQLHHEDNILVMNCLDFDGTDLDAWTLDTNR